MSREQNIINILQVLRWGKVDEPVDFIIQHLVQVDRVERLLFDGHIF